MTNTLGQLLAGGLLVLVAGVAGVAGYRIGIRRGMREGLEIGDLPEEAYRSGRRERQPPQPPSPPRVIH